MEHDLDKLSTVCSLKVLDILYRQLKKISSKYYKNGQMIDEYEKLLNTIFDIEHKIKLCYICDTKIDNRKIVDIDLCDNTQIRRYRREEILDYIVNYSRTCLVNNYCIKRSFDNLDVTNDCYISSRYISEICNALCIKYQILKIEPGFDSSARLFNGCGYHYFTLINLMGKKYLVDCTYKQFFKTNKSSLERLGIPGICAPRLGTFMQLDEKRKKVAEMILKQGWIEATEENIKHYFDGFALSFRNGLYYENFGINYNTDYTAEDYMRFMQTSDSQLNYENIEFLGPQKRPLGDYRLNFKIK